MDESLAEQVRQRAQDACEYCRMARAFYPTQPFPIDHIIARQHGGRTRLNNLAQSCLHCNLRKGPNIADFRSNLTCLNDTQLEEIVIL